MSVLSAAQQHTLLLVHFIMLCVQASRRTGVVTDISASVAASAQDAASFPPHLHVTSNQHLLPAPSTFLPTPHHSHFPPNAYHHSNHLIQQLPASVFRGSTSSSSVGKLGFYGSAVASIPHLHSTLANDSPITTRTAARIPHPSRLMTYPPLSLPPMLNVKSVADQVINRERERLQNELKAEIELELGSSGSRDEGDGREGEEGERDAAEEGKEEADNDVEKKDAKPFVEIDVRKLLLNYKTLKNLLEREGSRQSGLSRGLSRRMLMHGPLARIVISMVGPRMIRHQMAFMAQTLVAELLRKMLFPIAHSIVEKKFPALPPPDVPSSPSTPPDVGGGRGSSPANPNAPGPSFDPGHDCAKSHPHYPHHYHHDYEKGYQKGPYRSGPGTPYQAIGVQLLPINGLENEQQQKRQQHQAAGNDHDDRRPFDGRGADVVDEDAEEDDDELIFQIMSPGSSLNELNPASSQTMVSKSAGDARIFFLDAETILKGNKTSKTLVNPVKDAENSTKVVSKSDAGNLSVNSSTIESDKDANFPIIFLVSHPDRQSSASPSSPSASLSSPISSLSSGSRETSIRIDPAILDDRSTTRRPTSASDANIGNHRLENQLSSAGSSINSISISGPILTAAASSTPLSFMFGFPGHVISERVSLSKQKASDYDVERASRWDSIAKDMNKYHQKQREEQWQREMGE